MTMKSLFSLSAPLLLLYLSHAQSHKKTLSAPASLRTCAIASIVLPVVYTSSITRILSPSIRSVTWNAALRFCFLSTALSFFCDRVFFVLRTMPSGAGSPNCLPAFEARSAAWLNPLSRCFRGYIGTGMIKSGLHVQISLSMYLHMDAA